MDLWRFLVVGLALQSLNLVLAGVVMYALSFAGRSSELSLSEWGLLLGFWAISFAMMILSRTYDLLEIALLRDKEARKGKEAERVITRMQQLKRRFRWGQLQEVASASLAAIGVVASAGVASRVIPNNIFDETTPLWVMKGWTLALVYATQLVLALVMVRLEGAGTSWSPSKRPGDAEDEEQSLPRRRHRRWSDRRSHGKRETSVSDSAAPSTGIAGK